MVMMNFDTLNAVKQLQGFGFEQRQAEGVVEVLKETQSASIENLATKDDLKASENSLRGEIKDLRNEMKTQEAIVNAKFDVVKAELVSVKWILGVLTAAVVSFVIKSFFSL
ncbi:hypothetical protein FACS1894103_0600 [Campylobacterota bacterium]|nr:hypothetical protein FACS1894103_0510 [Campylobacterota bacterium]GHV58693.1 hypothetical protein FACS1894103_0600 [Campylobacterota bacterium]